MVNLLIMVIKVYMAEKMLNKYQKEKDSLTKMKY